MKVCILGATGNSGAALVKLASRRGHEVTAVVRSATKLSAADPAIIVRELDFSRHEHMVEAMAGHDVVINAAGYISQGDAFIRLFAQIVDAAEEALGPDGRFWMFAGAGMLKVPGTDRVSVTLPKVPPVFAPHLKNLERVNASCLNWSALCPGPMIDAPDGHAHQGLLVSTDEWPVPRPAVTRVLPWIATSLAFKSALGRMTIYYEDAAKVILDNLDPVQFSRKRVGIALPSGKRLEKPGYSTQPKPA